MNRVLVGLALLLAACDGDLDPPWQLDHDRIIAVRATPPAVESGQRSELDALLAIKGGVTSVEAPELAIVVSPESLAGTLTPEGGRWYVTAPSEDQLAAARLELGIDPGLPVPLRVGVSYRAQALFAVKTVWLGMTAQNPELVSVTMDNGPPPEGEIVVGLEVDFPLSVEALDTDDVNWLTSCGTMHDFDLPQAYLRVELVDPVAGELAVVRRDERGGVVWRVWPIRAE
ncbi:MAG: hypothetical protein WKG01_42475 [Kofleriaceae bacterium]